MIIEEFEDAIGVLVHPSHAKKKMNFEGAIFYFYKYSAIPFIFGAILSALIGNSAISVGLIYSWILYPIGIFFYACFIHFFGKFVFSRFRNSFSNTVVGAVYMSAPGVMFVWLSANLFFLTNSLVFTILFSFVMWVWEMIVGSVALSIQQSTTKLAAFASIITPTLIALVIALLLLSLLLRLLSVLGISFNLNDVLASKFCVGLQNFTCTGPRITKTGLISFSFSQNSGSTEYNVQFACVLGNLGTTYSKTGYSNAYGTSENYSNIFGNMSLFKNVASAVRSGQTLNVSGVQCYNTTGGIPSLQTGQTVGGALLENYTLNNNGIEEPGQYSFAVIVTRVS